MFDRTSFVEKKIDEWTERKEEFVKRSGFVLMAAKSVHDKQAKDKEFEIQERKKGHRLECRRTEENS
ncbi:hypothetical protein ACFLQO_00540 [Candidatus Aenigmatarchaeota archaeon]